MALLFFPENPPILFTSLEIEHLGLRAPDFDSAIAWYTEKLDFRLTQLADEREKLRLHLTDKRLANDNSSFAIGS